MSATPPVMMNILIADDDPVFRSLVEARLMHLGSTLHAAADGSEAWRVTRTHKLDLALVDFEMPGLDGIALTRCLRSHPDTKHIPIVMCTSRTDSGAMLAALEAGVSSFMTKPVNWSLFERHIGHLLHASQESVRASEALGSLRAAHASKDAIVTRLATALAPLLHEARKHEAFKPVADEATTLLRAYRDAAAELKLSGDEEPDGLSSLYSA